MHSPARNTILRILGFTLSAVLIIIGIMFMRWRELSYGVMLLAVALPLFLLSVRSIEINPPTDDEYNILKPYLVSGLLFLLAIGLTIALIFNVTGRTRTPELDDAATTEWLLSVLSLTIGVLWVAYWRPIYPRDVWEWIKANQGKFELVIAIILAILIIRTAALVMLDAARITIGTITISFNQISLIVMIIVLAIDLDWMLVKWLKKKQKSSAKIKSAPEQNRNFFVYPLFSVIKQKTPLSIGWWKHKRSPARGAGGDRQFQRFSQTKNLLIAVFNTNAPIRNATLYIVGFVLPTILTVIAIMLMQRQGFPAGVILLAVALPLFLLSIRFIKKKPLTDEETTILKPYIAPGLLFLVTICFTVILIFNITDYLRTPKLDYLSTVEWLSSILSLTISILWVTHWKPIQPRDIWESIKANHVEFGLATAIILAGLIIRMIGLTEHPYPWSGDEASVGLDAIRIMNSGITNLFDTSWSGQPNVSFLPTTLSMIVFGKTMLAIKMMSVFTGTFSILALYLLAREWFGREIALISSGFLIAYPFHLQFSRIGVDNIFDSLMAPLVIWLIFRAVRLKTLPAYLLAGIASGLTIYTYVGTRLVLAMAFGTIVYITIKQKDYLKTNLPQLGTYLAGLVVTVTPMATFFIKRPELFMTRLGQEGIFLNGWVSSQVQQTGLTVWQILLNQFLRTTLVFFAQNARSNFLNFDRPYLTILGAVFFVIGLAVAFRHFFDQRYFILQMWFWSVLTLGGFLTMNSPANTRLVMTIPATALFIALGASQVSNVLVNLKFKQAWIYGLNFLLILTLAYQNLSFYFGAYWQGRYSQNANGELGMETGLQLQKLGEDYDYYLLGVPRVFAKFPTTDFLTPNNAKYDVNAETISELSINSHRGAYFVAIPENQELLQQIIKKYPGGSFETIIRKMTTEVLYYAYILHPEAANTP